MENILHYLATHQWAYTLAIIVGLCIVYFIFKQLMKMALLFTLILLAIGGYLYMKNPQKMMESMQKTVKEMKAKSGDVIRDAKQLYNAGKKFPGEINRLIDGKEQAKKDPDKEK
jgi:hypothetical protein